MRGSLPRLITLYEELKEKRDKFEILAVHSDSAKTLAELDQKLERIITGVWGGKTLPFPILLDGNGESFKEYGIVPLPTLVLIDPEGNVVRGGDEEVLERKLRD